MHVWIYFYSIHVPGWQLKWLNLITAPGSVSSKSGSVSHMTNNQVFENAQLEKSYWKMNYIIPQSIKYWPKINIPSSHFTILMLNYFEKYSQTPVWQLCGSCQILNPINYQNNLTWPNSNTAGVSLDFRLKYSKITHRYAKKLLHSLGSFTDNFPVIQISSILSVNFTSPVA